MNEAQVATLTTGRAMKMVKALHRLRTRDIAERMAIPLRRARRLEQDRARARSGELAVLARLLEQEWRALCRIFDEDPAE